MKIRKLMQELNKRGSSQSHHKKNAVETKKKSRKSKDIMLNKDDGELVYILVEFLRLSD